MSSQRRKFGLGKPNQTRYTDAAFDEEAHRMSSAIAQLVEQAAVNRWVVGSSPTRGAILFFPQIPSNCNGAMVPFSAFAEPLTR